MSYKPRSSFETWRVLIFGGIILEIILRFVPFDWAYVVISLMLGAFGEYIYGMYLRNPWETVGGILVPIPVVMQCHGSDKRYRQTTLSNPCSHYKSLTLNLLNELGIDINELWATARQHRQERLLPSQAITMGSRDQQLLQELEGQAPETEGQEGPEDEEVQIDDYDVEIISGIGRGKVRQKIYVILKPTSAPLFGSDYCSSATRRRRPRYFLTLLHSQPLGVHYAPGFGSFQLTFAISELTGQIPSYLMDWMEKVALMFTDVSSQIVTLRMEVLSHRGIKEELKLYKGMYKKTLDELAEAKGEVGDVNRIFAKTQLPSPKDRMERERPQAIPESKPKRKFNMKLLLLGFMGAIPGIWLYNNAGTVTLASLPWLTPNIAIAMGIAIFAVVFYFGRRYFRI